MPCPPLCPWPATGYLEPYTTLQHFRASPHTVWDLVVRFLSDYPATQWRVADEQAAVIEVVTWSPWPDNQYGHVMVRFYETQDDPLEPAGFVVEYQRRSGDGSHGLCWTQFEALQHCLQQHEVLPPDDEHTTDDGTHERPPALTRVNTWALPVVAEEAEDDDATPTPPHNVTEQEWEYLTRRLSSPLVDVQRDASGYLLQLLHHHPACWRDPHWDWPFLLERLLLSNDPRCWMAVAHLSEQLPVTVWPRACWQQTVAQPPPSWVHQRPWQLLQDHAQQRWSS